MGLALIWLGRIPKMDGTMIDPLAQRDFDYYWRSNRWEMPESLPKLTPPIAIDTETYDPELTKHGPGWAFPGKPGHIAGISVATADFCGYFPIRHVEGGNLDVDRVLEWAREQFRQPGPMIFANATYDLGWLRREGVHVFGEIHDVQLQAPLINETLRSFKLDALGLEYLNAGKNYSEMEAICKARKVPTRDISKVIHLLHSSYVGAYAEQDAQLTLDLWHHFNNLLETDGLIDLYELERSLIPMLLQMRWKGVRVDLDQTEALKKNMANEQQRYLKAIKDETGILPDLWAAADVAKVFDAIQVSYPRTEKTNAPSFRKEWLEVHPHPVAKMIHGARKLDKFQGTFLQGYLLDGHHNGRVHANFNQLRGDSIGTVSGRFSSSQPNLQNIPQRDIQWGKQIRALFIPEPGEQWWKFDWSQIEYRLIVHYAHRMKFKGAREAVELYRLDRATDYHQVIADMTGLDRASAKNLNFGLAYGQGIALLCANLGVNELEGRRIINEYHTRAPFIRMLSKSCENKALEKGRIRTILNRRRRFERWESPDGSVHNIKGEDEDKRVLSHTHKALNALIQGSAADIMKKAMAEVWRSGVCDVLGCPLMTVHDELDGSMPQTPLAHEALRELAEIMENCVKLEVPLLVDCEIGANWGNLEEMKR